MNPETAIEKAVLNERQLAFRNRKNLVNALPYTVWGLMWFRLKPGQRNKPVAHDGVEFWFASDQVCRSENAPNPPDHVTSPLAIKRFFSTFTPHARQDRQLETLIMTLKDVVFRSPLTEDQKKILLRPITVIKKPPSGVPITVIEARREARKSLVRQGRSYRRT